MPRLQLRGCGTALVTPFLRDGALDLKTLAELVEWQIDCGINFLVACGTTGETPTLEEEEWLDVIRTTVEAANDRVPVLAGCTHNSTREAVRKAQKVAEIPGVHGLLTASPYYNKPSQEGQFQHFQVIASSMALPLVLYNIPGRTGVNLEPKTIARIVDSVPTIIGVKESSGDLPQITELIHLMPRNVPVFAGDDTVALAAIGVGAAGLISVASNEIPREIRKMVIAALADDWDGARALNQKYYELMQANFWEPSPGPVKCIMAMMGRIQEAYRLPIVPPSSTTRKRLQKLAAVLKLVV
jgi:4-hydroxy-tetrahydrodipicolinate synthase